MRDPHTVGLYTGYLDDLILYTATTRGMNEF